MNWIGLYTLIREEMDRFLRTISQTLVAPWISATLFIFVFGSVLGGRINLIEGIPYTRFVLPGILMMNVIISAYSQSSFSLYFQRFTRSIEEILVAPLSYNEMIIGYLTGSVARAVFMGIGILIIGVFFNAVSVYNLFLFLFYIVGVSLIFGLIGLIMGLWADSFEQLMTLNTFILMPLSFLGGIFNSTHMLPSGFRAVAQFNPLLYFIDGLRYSMIGYHETNLAIGVSLIIISTTILFTITWHLFNKGWRLRT